MGKEAIAEFKLKYPEIDRTDIYPREVLKEMTTKAGKLIAYQGKILKHGCSYVWIEA